MSVNILTRPVPLSRRLAAIVELAGSGSVVCDVGCDHAHVPIRLLQTGQYERAIGMDVLPGPLGKAAGNLALYGMEGRVKLRQSDGMDAFCENEADALVITGMGGTLMREILLREPQKTCSLKKLVLGPQSDPDKVRSALRELGFMIEEECLIFEDGKYYPILRAARSDPAGFRKAKAPDPEGCSIDSGRAVIPDSAGLRGRVPFSPDIPGDIRQEAEDLFGPVLLARRDPMLGEFLVRQTAVLEKILHSVNQALQKMDDVPDDGAQALWERHLARKKEIEHSLVVFRAALTAFTNAE